MKLQELESLIANLGTGDETVTDQAFEDRLKEAEREVTDLLREAQEVKGIVVKWGHLISNSYSFIKFSGFWLVGLFVF